MINILVKFSTLVILAVGLTACGDKFNGNGNGNGTNIGIQPGSPSDPTSLAYFQQTIGDRAVGEIAEILCLENQVANEQGDGGHHHTGGENASHAPFIETDNRATALGQFTGDDGCNEESGNYEKDVNADVTAADQTETRVIKHDGKNGYCTQAVNIWSVCRSCHGCGLKDSML